MASRSHNIRETLHRCNNDKNNNKVNNCDRRPMLMCMRPKFDKCSNQMMSEQPAKGFKRKKSVLAVNQTMWCCAIVIALLPIIVGQYSTRDPRFYSREGDFNYKWPNPGDPDYR